MALPINISELINGHIVEWERIEFKKGWNPEDVIHTICAFANDFNNWGGGYIIIGIEEKDNRPLLPPKGLSKSEIHNIQKELLSLCRRINPPYFPIAEPVYYESKFILIIWIPGGQNRPYKAPKSLSKNRESNYYYYIRRFNNTVRATLDEERELLSLTAKIPYDDRINHSYTINDLKLPLIQDFLKETNSDLYNISSNISFEQLCRQMAIINGPGEDIKPKNVGLLFFNDHPEKIFYKSQIEIVIFRDGVAGNNLTEKIFEGPIHYQVRNALNFLRNEIIKEYIHKVPYQAEAIRFFNYPYVAIEEILVNAIYHRSYEIQEPVEIRIHKDKIEVLSFPGPDRSIKEEDLKKGYLVARRYRNRRIGEFLKELKLTEGRSTGIPKVIKSMKDNGSPPPIFKTDKERTYFLVTLPIHKGALKELEAQEKAHVEAHEEAQEEAYVELTKTEWKILKECSITPISSKELTGKLGHLTLSGNVKKAISNLIKRGLIVYTVPDKPRSKNQRYRITNKGKKTFEKYRENKAS